MAAVSLSSKTVRDDWVVYALQNVEASGEGVSPADWTDVRAHLRTHDGTLLASSDDAEVEGDVVAISFDGDVEKGIPAMDLEADPAVFCAHIAETGGFPSGNAVYLQVSATAVSIQGRQTVGTFSWVVDAEIEVSDG